MNEKTMSKTATLVSLATLSCALWGSAPSCIKLGYEYFQISAGATMNIILFAGIRFTLAGLMVILGYSLIKRKPIVPARSCWKAIFPLALAQTAVQYILYYIGAAHASGVNTSILSGSGAFFSVILVCLLFRQEKLTAGKFFGCLIGLAGIILVTLQGSGASAGSVSAVGSVGAIGSMASGVSLLGEGCVLLSTISSAVSAILIRIFSQDNDPVMLSGYQFATGGLIMVGLALAGGGTLPQVCTMGLVILFYLALVSAVAYTLWSLLLRYNPVSKVTVFNFLVPVFGVILSTILLGEGGIFSITTLGSLVLVCIGIMMVNSSKSA